MAKKGDDKPRAKQYDQVATNKNWEDCIRKEQNSAVEWINNWGFLIGGEEHAGFGNLDEQIQGLEAQYQELSKKSKHDAPGFQTASAKLGEGKSIDNQKRFARQHFKEIIPTNPY